MCNKDYSLWDPWNSLERLLVPVYHWETVEKNLNWPLLFVYENGSMGSTADCKINNIWDFVHDFLRFSSSYLVQETDENRRPSPNYFAIRSTGRRLCVCIVGTYVCVWCFICIWMYAWRSKIYVFLSVWACARDVYVSVCMNECMVYEHANTHIHTNKQALLGYTCMHACMHAKHTECLRRYAYMHTYMHDLCAQNSRNTS